MDWPTDTAEMEPVTGRHHDPRRRFWRRAVIVLAVLVVATGALLIYLLAAQDDAATTGTGPLGSGAAELRSRAVDINTAWDDQEAVVSEDERARLCDETELQLEALVIDTRTFADRAADLAGSMIAADREAVDAATADMVLGAEQMLEGLRVPGRTNKDQRLEGLDRFTAAADQVIDVAGPTR